MEQLTTRDALLGAVRSLRDEIERVAVGAGEERATRPGSFDGWAFKDVIAHLTGWRHASVARLEAGLRGEEPVMPWPAHLDEENDLDEINRWMFEGSRDKTFSEVMDESRETFERVERAIAALPEEALLKPGHFPWLPDDALGPAVVQGTVGHYREEHEPDIQAWLARG